LGAVDCERVSGSRLWVWNSNIDSLAGLAPRISDGSLRLRVHEDPGGADPELNDCLTATDLALIAALDDNVPSWDRCNNP